MENLILDPDYLAYHLNENFEHWYSLQKTISFHNFKDISICTDGIFTFSNFDNQKYPKIDFYICEYLLKDYENHNNAEMLKKKVRYIERIYGLAPTDDLGIIRIIKTDL